MSAFAHYLGWLCSEFPGKLPSEVWAERDRLPEGMLEEIIESRNYARAYWTYKANPKATGDMVQRVRENDFALAQEAIDARG